MSDEHVPLLRLAARRSLGAVRSTLRRVGFDLVRQTVETSGLVRRQRLLAQAGIDVVIDVGAHVGEYAAELRRSGYRGFIVSYEPLPAAARALRLRAASDERWSVRELALDEVPGKATLHVAGNEVSSSLLPMTKRHVEGAPTSAYVEDVEVQVTTLALAVEHALTLGKRVFVKIDAQGAEARILQGARIDDVVGFQLELSLTPLYEGTPLLHELVARMATLGFSLVSLEDGFTDLATGRQLQADGVFLRD